MTKQTNINTVCHVLRQLNDNDAFDITTRLIISINRAKDNKTDAMETVKMADRLKLETGGLVVGVDLSGNPKVSRVKTTSY